MDLSGHRTITNAAVKEFVQEQGARSGQRQGQLQRVTYTKQGPVTTPLSAFAVQRDLIDVLTTGHWSNFGQKHHFMRNFDGQSPYQAYTTACEWIRSNAFKFAVAAIRGRGSEGLAPLGYACHALEDSFAKGHVVRAPHLALDNPGAIEHLKRYTGEEKKDHAHFDTEWQGTGNNLSRDGTIAKNGVKALLYTIFEEVDRAAKTKCVDQLSGWQRFRLHWLKPSPKLQKVRDEAYDFVDKFYSGIVWGNSQHATNVDEEGMAKAVYSRFGADTSKVKAVFVRLDEFHTVDADDVANYYVDLMRKDPKGGVARAVARDKSLIELLVRILDEGWTTSGENECIEFLRALK